MAAAAQVSQLIAVLGSGSEAVGWAWLGRQVRTVADAHGVPTTEQPRVLAVTCVRLLEDAANTLDAETLRGRAVQSAAQAVEDWERTNNAAGSERFQLLTRKHQGTLTPHEAERLAEIERERALIHREEWEEFEAEYPASRAGRFEANLAKLEQLVAGMNRPQA